MSVIILLKWMKIISSKEFITLQTQQIAVNGDQSLLRPMNIGVKTAGPLWVNFTLLVAFLLTILNFSLFFLLAYSIPLWGIEVAREYDVACMMRPSYRVDVIMMKSFHRLRLMRYRSE